MKIGEASERLGISISNIRFYEKKGLIGPQRDEESKYRNYTEEDLDEIKRIIVLRKMGMSIETITDIQNGDISVQEALKNQLEALDEEEDKIYASRSLCLKAIGDGSKTMEEMAGLFDYVAEEEEQGTKYAPAEEFLDNLADSFNYDHIVATLPWGFMIYTSPVYNKVGKIFWLLYVIMLPLFIVVTAIVAKRSESMSITKVGILAVWLIIVLINIIKSAKSVKIVKTKQE